MTSLLTLCLLLTIACLSHCRDYYIGMFKRNDLLMAQDRLYKEKVPYRKTYAKYGRVFPCPITYFRIVDRLGYGGGPRVEVIRGGLRKKYIVARLTSPYDLPISVNIYVGCENKIVRTKKRPKTTTTTVLNNAKDANGTTTSGSGNTVDDGGKENETAANQTLTTEAGAGHETTTLA